MLDLEAERQRLARIVFENKLKQQGRACASEDFTTLQPDALLFGLRLLCSNDLSCCRHQMHNFNYPNLLESYLLLMPRAHSAPSHPPSLYLFIFFGAGPRP